MNENFLLFEYDVPFTKTIARAKAIFTWCEENKNFHYWWFEDSGNYMEANCKFINESTLYVDWLNSPLIQAFCKSNDGKILLKLMNQSVQKQQLIMKVIFSQKIKYPYQNAIITKYWTIG